MGGTRNEYTFYALDLSAPRMTATISREGVFVGSVRMEPAAVFAWVASTLRTLRTVHGVSVGVDVQLAVV